MKTQNTTTGAGGISAAQFLAVPNQAARRPIAVGTCYTTADKNGVAVIGAMVTWSDGESGEMTWPNTRALCAFTRNYYGV
jgi:hypothetical protein